MDWLGSSMFISVFLPVTGKVRVQLCSNRMDQLVSVKSQDHEC